MPKESTASSSQESAAKAQEAMKSPTAAMLRRTNAPRARAPPGTTGKMGAGPSSMRTLMATRLVPTRTPIKQTSKPRLPAPKCIPALTEISMTVSLAQLPGALIEEEHGTALHEHERER